MPEPTELGPIYWSAAGQNFYQTGRVGPVPRLEALESLTIRETDTGPRLVDELGRLVPDIPDLIPREFQTQYINATRTATLLADFQYDQAPGQGKYYTTLFTYTDLNGDLRLGIKRNAIGQALDPEVERAKIIAQIGADLELDPNSDEGGSNNIDPLISPTLFHFLTE